MKLLEKLAHVTAKRRLEKRAYGYFPGMGGMGGMNPYGMGGMMPGYGGGYGGFPMEMQSYRHGPNRGFHAGMNPMFAGILAQRHGIANQAAMNSLGPQSQMQQGAANMQAQYSPLVQTQLGQYNNLMGHAVGNPKNEYIDPQASGMGAAAREGTNQENTYNAELTRLRGDMSKAQAPLLEQMRNHEQGFKGLSAQGKEYLYQKATSGDPQAVAMLKDMGLSSAPQRQLGDKDWSFRGIGAQMGMGEGDFQNAVNAHTQWNSLKQQQEQLMSPYQKDIAEKEKSLEAYRAQQRQQTSNMTGAAAQQHNQTVQGVGDQLQRRNVGMQAAQNTLAPAETLAQPGMPGGKPSNPSLSHPQLPQAPMPSTSIGMAKGGSFIDRLLAKQAGTFLEDALIAAGKAGGAGAMIGAPVGALAAGSGHRLEGAGRGAGVGLTTGLGSAAGGMIGGGLGGLAGHGLGKLIAARTGGDPRLASAGMLAGSVLGGGAGLALGGLGGLHQGMKLTKKKEEKEEKEAAQREAALRAIK